METNRVLRAVTVGLRGDVRFDAPLKEWTSFRIGGPADVLVIPEDVEDLCRLLRQAHARLDAGIFLTSRWRINWGQSEL